MALVECTVVALTAIRGAIAGVDGQLNPCYSPATHRVLLRHDIDGVRLELLSAVCPEHELALSTEPAYQRAIQLRQHQT